ncbi:MAG: hypothetical protein P1U65_15525 [Minwuia sp.]|nr:hypothetical protein [Minwuia sp.]
MTDFNDPSTPQKLAEAAEIITRHLDLALEESQERGLDREVFSAAVMATLVQAMQTALGSSAKDALRDMVELLGNDGSGPAN